MENATDLRDGWQGILDNDEEILWQGRPDTKIVLTFQNITLHVFGLVLIAIGLLIFHSFWGFFLSISATPVFFLILASLFALVPFGLGLYIAFCAILGPPRRRRHTWYTLTNTRAIVTTAIPFKTRQIVSYSVKPESFLELGEGSLPTLYFGRKTIETARGLSSIKMGFERIPDGATVYEMARNIQRHGKGNRP